MSFYVYFKILIVKTNQKRAFSLGKFTKLTLFHPFDLIFKYTTKNRNTC
ncbi:hypothetical protein SAMN05192550_0055 [Flavobacterium glycines]|uniref:Uncharacterized protein n=1 Tax=Flavobacterium glycines TaxID=551990 RepID=A0A1G8L2T6_9FLAO|nr:hypothetical protein SAMN05192550_0055 [Flavobacterium glycines]